MNHFDIFVQIEFRELFQKALQILLANSIAAQKAEDGGAALLLEKDATGDALYDAARGILDDPEKRASMSRAMAELGIPDATERIFRAVMALVKK